MAYAFDVNGTIPGTSGWLLFRFMVLLESQGWVITQAGDGLSNYTAVPVTSAWFAAQGATGAFGLGNDRAWFVVQSPGAFAREFCFQNSSSNYQGRIKYSGTASFSIGSPDFQTVPAATDEIVLRGVGSDASPGFQAIMDNPPSVARMNALAGGAAEGYGFLLWTNYAGSPSISTFMMLDPMVPGTYIAGDTDPSVQMFNWFDYNCLVDSMWGNSYSGAPMGWLQKGLAGEGYRPINGNRLVGSNADDNNFPNGDKQNLYNGKDMFLPIQYARAANAFYGAPTGYKGVATILKWTSLSRGFGTTYTVTTPADYITIGRPDVTYCALPWNGSMLVI